MGVRTEDITTPKFHYYWARDEANDQHHHRREDVGRTLEVGPLLY